MEVNSTLLVQMGNFLLTYFVLKKYLFPLVVDAIRYDRQKITDEHDYIAHYTKQIAQKEAELQSHWASCREFFRARVPSLKPIRRILRYKEPKEALIIDEAIREKLAHTIERHLIQEVDRVRR